MADPVRTAAQALLRLSEITRVKPRVKYSALFILTDRYLPSANIPGDLQKAIGGGEDSKGKSTGNTDWLLILLAASAIYLASNEANRDNGEEVSHSSATRKEVFELH